MNTLTYPATFHISRTSQPYYSSIEGAGAEKIMEALADIHIAAEPQAFTVIDRRYYPTTDHMSSVQLRYWLAEGTDHTVVDGCIQRTLGQELRPVVTFASSEELIAFLLEERVIVGAPNEGYLPALPTLEIYDDYRE